MRHWERLKQILIRTIEKKKKDYFLHRERERETDRKTDRVRKTDRERQREIEL